MYYMVMIMNLHFQKTNKNQLECVPCLPSCVPFSINGKHVQALSHKTLNAFVYHVYHYARMRMCAFYIYVSILIKLNHSISLKKYSHVRLFIFIVHMVNICLKAICIKGLLCLPFFYNGTQKAETLNIAFQDIDFKLNNLCTIVYGFFSYRKESF